VAETGSVLVSAAPPGGRAPSLVVPVHVVFLPEERVLGTVEEVFDAIDRLDDLPSNLVLITGPSKSADIGMELAVGVHGPGEVHVVLTS
jgi:L-lactate dehydrogenase complex protein LldG